MNNSIDFCVTLILIFFSFSIIGWCIEVFLKYLQYHRFINRGFLIGPYCPIYGAGAVLITVSVGYVSCVDSSYGTTFLISFVVCGTLEYLVSYVMEKRFHARWWDYSQKPMNLNGRIWIGNLVLFGLGGTIIIKVADPILYRLFDMMTSTTRLIVSIFVVIAMLSDYITSHFVMKLIKSSIEKSEADNTEAIGREIRLLLNDRSILYRRIADAYPNVTYKTERITNRLRAIKEEANNFMSNIETTSSIKNGIIEKQDELIALLENENIDIDAVNTLKQDIAQQKNTLSQREHRFTFGQN